MAKNGNNLNFHVLDTKLFHCGSVNDVADHKSKPFMKINSYKSLAKIKM